MNLYHIFKTNVKKIGKREDYVNLPVTNRSIYRFTYDSLDSNTVAVGTVTEVVELEESYELTITLWDRFVSLNMEFVKDENELVKPTAFSISMT